MASWKLHRKWCEALGIDKDVCREVTRLIDKEFPHDIVDNVLKWGWARESFESGNLTSTVFVTPEDKYGKVTKALAEITNRFGIDGVRATFNHIALDRVTELIELGYDKEQIRQKLTKLDLMKYIPDYDEVFKDIQQEVKPSEEKIKRRKDFEKLAKSGIYGVFYIDGKLLPAIAGLNYIKGKVSKGEEVYVKWGIDSYEARRGKIARFVSDEKELWELIDDIKYGRY